MTRPLRRPVACEECAWQQVEPIWRCDLPGGDARLVGPLSPACRLYAPAQEDCREARRTALALVGFEPNVISVAALHEMVTASARRAPGGLLVVAHLTVLVPGHGRFEFDPWGTNVSFVNCEFRNDYEWF